MPWHFVSLDQEISKEIRDKFPNASMVKVEATIMSSLHDKMIVIDVVVTTWTTSLFRNNRDKNYLLPIKKDIRKSAGLQDGDVVEVGIRVL